MVMRTLKHEAAPDLEVQINEEGFLMQTDTWNREVAEVLAQEEMQDSLTEDHWKVLNFIRSYFKKFVVAPAEQITCKETGIDVHQIAGLFPTGYAQGACKIAGLPKPDPHMFGLLTNYARA